MDRLAKLSMQDLIESFFLKLVASGEYSQLYIYELKLFAHKLVKFAEGLHEKYLTPELCDLFLRTEYGHVAEMSRRSVGCLTTMLLHFQTSGELPANRLKNVDFPEGFAVAFEGFLETRVGLVQERTLRNDRYRLIRAAKYLTDNGVPDVSAVNRDAIVDYTTHLQHFDAKTANGSLSLLSRALKHAFEQGLIAEDVSQYCMKVRYFKGEKIPPVFTLDEIERTLSAVDRTTDIGKRDYAMIMLSSRTGLRGVDIAKLKFSNLRFDTDTIELTQSKTGKAIVLPLTEDVGLALIDYIRNGRPKSDSKFIFLRHYTPFCPIKGPLNVRVRRNMELAGIENYTVRRPGFHALRHSLATNMLKNNTSIYYIKEYLGHESIDTTRRYIKVDHESLRQCALEVPPTCNR